MGKQAKLKAARRAVRQILKEKEKVQVVKVSSDTIDEQPQSPPDLGVHIIEDAQVVDVFGRR